jgi:hypothetical protein
MSLVLPGPIEGIAPVGKYPKDLPENPAGSPFSHLARLVASTVDHKSDRVFKAW